MEFLSGYFIFQNGNTGKEIEKANQIAKEGIEDECTEAQRLYEMGMLENLENSEETSSSDAVISPNAKILIKKHYAGCNHTTKDYAEVPSEIVNFTKEQLEDFYPDWEIEEFSNDEIVIRKEYEGICDEHYKISQTDGFVTVYSIDEEGKENLVLKTDVSTQYLPETDLEALREGIKVIGKDALNSILEDYE